MISLPEGTKETVTVNAELTDTLNGSITNTDSRTTSAGTLELAPADNSGSDTDLAGLFADGMERVEPD